MLLYAVQRLFYVLPIALGVSLICFLLVHLAPGDPVSAILPENAPPELVQQVKQAYGLDKPLPVQYVLWLGHVATGDFGRSITTRRPVLAEVLPAVGNTLALAGGAILLGCGLGIFLGTLAGTRDGMLLDRLITSSAVAGVSVPPYWLGMVLIGIFAVDLGWLPATGMGQGRDGGFAFTLDGLKHLILPTIALSVIPAGIIARSVRATVAEVRQRDFVWTLQAKGMGRARVLLHVAKNAAPSVLAVIGLQFAHLLGGSILIETVFAWPGTGFLLNAAIFTRDLPILQGTILILAMFFVMINLVVDLVQMMLDPRIKRG
jgi:peptide/nickel transport system permease protein